jgi:HEAT repeat protein
MEDLRFIQFAILTTLALTLLMVIVTVGAKFLRTLRQAWYKYHYRRIEPALENYLLTGEPQPELEKLRFWQRDRFLSTLMIERMALLKGAGRDSLTRLARDLGLVERYLEVLVSRGRWRRAWAAENLGYFGGPKAAGPISALLSHEDDETVRAVAARALARIGTPDAVEALVRTLDDPSELTRLRATENLERLGELVVEPLTDFLENATALSAEPLYGTVLATRVLGNLRASRTREALRRASRYGSEVDLRAQATLALGKIGDPEDVPTLLEATRDESWPVRAQAAKALGMIGEASTLSTLKELASDEAWWVRRNACQALANMGPGGEKALVELLQGEDRYARDQAAASMESRGIIRRMVRQLAREGPRGERARMTVRALVKAGTTSYLRSLAASLPEGEERRVLRGLLKETIES